MKTPETNKEDYRSAMMYIFSTIDGEQNPELDVWWHGFTNLREEALDEDSDKRIPDDMCLAEHYEGCDADEAYEYVIDTKNDIVRQRESTIRTLSAALIYMQNQQMHLNPNDLELAYSLGRKLIRGEIGNKQKPKQ
jgi:hypothetical protein